MIICVPEKPEFQLKLIFASLRKAILIVIEPEEYAGKLIVLPEIDLFLIAKRQYFKKGEITETFTHALETLLEEGLERLNSFSREDEIRALPEEGTKYLVESYGLSRSESHGFFISPEGDIYSNNGLKHIDCILKNPERFRLEKDYLKNKFAKYREPYGFEGKARGMIIRKLVKDGWIHLRYFPKKSEWIFNVNSIISSIDRLYDFTLDCYINGLIKPDDTILIKERDKFPAYFKSTCISGGFLFFNVLKSFYISGENFCCACCIHEMNNHLLNTAETMTHENVGVCLLRKVIIPDAAHTKCRSFIENNPGCETIEDFEREEENSKRLAAKYHIIRGSLWTNGNYFKSVESFNEPFNNLNWDLAEVKRWNGFVKDILDGVERYSFKVHPYDQNDSYPSQYTEENYKDLFTKFMELAQKDNFPCSNQPFIAWDEAFNKKLNRDPEYYELGDGKTFLPNEKFESIAKKHFLKEDDKLNFVAMDNRNRFIIFTKKKAFIVKPTKTYEGDFIESEEDDYPEIKFAEKEVNDREVAKLFKMYYELDLGAVSSEL